MKWVIYFMDFDILNFTRIIYFLNKILKDSRHETPFFGNCWKFLPSLQSNFIDFILLQTLFQIHFKERCCAWNSHRQCKIVSTDGRRILHTLLVKHYNDFLNRQSSERGKDEVTYFYVGDVFCIHLGIKYADFQGKIFAEISGKKFQTLGIK